MAHSRFICAAARHSRRRPGREEREEFVMAVDRYDEGSYSLIRTDARNVGRRYNSLTTHRQGWHRDDVPSQSSGPSTTNLIQTVHRPVHRIWSVAFPLSRCLVAPAFARLVSSDPTRTRTQARTTPDTTDHALSVGPGRSARRYVIRVTSCPVAGQARGTHGYVLYKTLFRRWRCVFFLCCCTPHTSSLLCLPGAKKTRPGGSRGGLARRKRDKGKAVRAPLAKASTWGVGWVTGPVAAAPCPPAPFI
jgi:hypothetical protein